MNCKLLLFLPLLTALSACVDNIDLPRPDSPDSGMFVQGRLLFGQPSVATAGVYQIATSINNVPQPIGGAKVFLEDNHGRSMILPAATTTGQYALEFDPESPDFPVQTGSAYRISVSLPNGKKYTSEWETLLPAPKPDSVSVVFKTKDYFDSRGQLRNDTFAFFGVNTPIRALGSTLPVRFRWELDLGFQLTDDPGNVCYILRKLLAENIFAFDGAAAGLSRLDNYALTETLVDYRFAEGFYITVYQQAIGENAYGYFDELHQLLSKRGTLFDPPAGAIRSNIFGENEADELVFGFFYVAQQDTVRAYVSPDQANFPGPYCPLPPTNGEAPNPTACDYCGLEYGATLEKPIWWKF